MYSIIRRYIHTHTTAQYLFLIKNIFFIKRKSKPIGCAGMGAAYLDRQALCRWMVYNGCDVSFQLIRILTILHGMLTTMLSAREMLRTGDDISHSMCNRVNVFISDMQMHHSTSSKNISRAVCCCIHRPLWKGICKGVYCDSSVVKRKSSNLFNLCWCEFRQDTARYQGPLLRDNFTVEINRKKIF